MLPTTQDWMKLHVTWTFCLLWDLWDYVTCVQVTRRSVWSSEGNPETRRCSRRRHRASLIPVSGVFLTIGSQNLHPCLLFYFFIFWRLADAHYGSVDTPLSLHCTFSPLFHLFYPVTVTHADRNKTKQKNKDCMNNYNTYGWTVELVPVLSFCHTNVRTAYKPTLRYDVLLHLHWQNDIPRLQSAH